ncbi:MAG: hypothetical protein EXQ96_04385 [Alphaproteobacteria bacterium]|nr:hypothetical protein [Alphaproteobacteria bacterium]
MKIDAHLEKLRNTESVRRRLDPKADYELWYWMTLTGGTAAINAALHSVGATDDGDYWCTQAPDIYLGPGKKPGEFTPSFRRRADIIHVHMPDVSAKLPPELDEAIRAMDVLEEVRDPYIRGDAIVTQEVVDRVDGAYRKAVELAREIVAKSGRAVA